MAKKLAVILPAITLAVGIGVGVFIPGPAQSDRSCQAAIEVADEIFKETTVSIDLAYSGINGYMTGNPHTMEEARQGLDESTDAIDDVRPAYLDNRKQCRKG